MISLFRVLTTPRLWTLLILPNLGFTALALVTPAFALIATLNLVVIALAVNVCVAFAPNVLDALFSRRRIDKADLLSLGIFSAWFSVVLGTGLAIVWRYLGEPMWLVNTDFSSYRAFMLVCAAIFHLLAPGSLKESIPPLRWVKIGAIAAVAVFVALALLYASDLRRGMDRIIRPHDHEVGPTQYIVPL